MQGFIQDYLGGGGGGGGGREKAPSLRMKPCGDVCFSIMVSPVVLTTAPPSLKELSNALSSVTKWYTLGVKMGLESHDLATIQQDYPHDSNRCRDEMIACCLRSANPPTWKTTADALCQMGEHHLADKIRTKHPGSFTTISKHLLVLSTLDACLCASVHCTIEMCNNSEQVSVAAPTYCMQTAK